MTTLHFSAREAYFDESLAIRGLGLREQMPPGQVNRPEGAGFWLLLLFHTPVPARLKGQDISLPARSVCLLRPGTQHRFGDPDKPWSHSWLLVQGSAFEGFLQASGYRVDLPCPVASASTVLDYLEGIYRELSQHAKPRLDMLADWTHLLLRDLARATGGPSDSEVIPQALQEVRQYMEGHLDRKLELADLARKAHLSKSQFIAVFRRYYGRSPIRYLLGLRMRRAALLLRDHGLAVSQVACLVGIADPLYFSRLFRKHMGCSPTDHRHRS